VKLPYQAGWQDLKDLFRSAGNIVRADINIGMDGRPKGSGTVIFESAKDAQNAIGIILHKQLGLSLTWPLGMYNGFEWYGRVLEVREVTYIVAGPCGPYALIPGPLCWVSWFGRFPGGLSAWCATGSTWWARNPWRVPSWRREDFQSRFVR
jgi:hypothetical protein